MIRIGAQVSVSGGFQQTIEEAHDMELRCLQIFSRSPVGGQSRGLPQPNQMAQWLAGAHIRPLFVHAPYFVNPAATDRAMHDRACQVLGEEMLRVKQLAGDFLVIHPGHRQAGAEENQARQAFAQTIVYLLSKPGRILIENTAGQGKEIGSDFEDLAMIFNIIGRSSRVGAMVDTAHAMAVGYPLKSTDDWHRLTDVLESTVGLARIRGIHLNDTEFPVGSHRDRHAALLTGDLGPGALKGILASAQQHQWPLILETPGKSARERANDIAILSDLI